MMKKVFSGSVFSIQGGSSPDAVPLPAAGGPEGETSGSERGKTENRKLKTSVGFTLLELLVVIAIIAILAGLILSTAGFIQKEGARARAKAEVAALEAALESYKADNGDYPAGTNNPGTNGFNLLTNLLPPVSASNSKVYFELPNKGMTNSAGYLTDPFGNTYGYRYPGAATNNGTNFFDLWSTAGSTNTNAWIKNW